MSQFLDMIYEYAQNPRALFEIFQPETNSTNIGPDEWRNWLGLRTSIENFYVASNLGGEVKAELPIPDDGVYGGVGEYMATLLAVLVIKKLKLKSGYAVELGAAPGPWLPTFAKTLEGTIEELNLVGVEADSKKCEKLRIHFEKNNLMWTNLKVINAAIWLKKSTVYFPKDLPLDDMGAAAPSNRIKNQQDYRGKKYELQRVEAVSLKSVISEKEIVHLMHFDVQGAEFEVISKSISLLKSKALFIFIGTHSRAIEGKLLDLFYRNAEFALLHEKPCEFSYNPALPSLEGMTNRDGEMVWLNTTLLAELVSEHLNEN